METVKIELSDNSYKIDIGYQFLCLKTFSELTENKEVLLVYDKNSSEPLWEYVADEEINRCSVDISEDGSYVVAGSWDNNIYSFDTLNGTLRWIHETQSNIKCVAISSDGEYVTVGDTMSRVYFFKKDRWIYIGIFLVFCNWNNDLVGNIYLFHIATKKKENWKNIIKMNCNKTMMPGPGALRQCLLSNVDIEKLADGMIKISDITDN